MQICETCNSALNFGLNFGFSLRSQTSIASDDTAAALIMAFALIAFGQLSSAYAFATVYARLNTVDSLPPVSRFLPDLFSCR